jgi:EF hand.
MSDQELKTELKKAFDLFDKDGDGILHMDDFTRLIYFLGMTGNKHPNDGYQLIPDSRFFGRRTVVNL